MIAKSLTCDLVKVGGCGQWVCKATFASCRCCVGAILKWRIFSRAPPRQYLIIGNMGHMGHLVP